MDRSKWEYKKLGEVAQYPKNRLESESLDVGNYVGVENLLKDKAGRIDALSLPANTSTIEYKENDILIGNIRPYLKKIWLADRHGGASGDVVNIRVKENYRDRIYPNFLYCVLSTDAFFAFDMAHSKGAKMPRGNKDEIVKYSIPIPPIADQQRIVAELDCLNEMIALKQEQLKEFDKLAQSIFYDMFGDSLYDNMLLSDIGNIVTGSTPTTKNIENYSSNDICFFKPSDLLDGYVSKLDYS
jgi:type I restriction enzyme S subunit